MTSLRVSAPLYAGIGCRRGCSVETLERLLLDALAAHELSLAAVQGLASLDLKADEPGLLQLAERLALPLALFDAASLQRFDSLLTHRSDIAFQHTGCRGVAESAALAMASAAGRSATLRVPRQACDSATVALASSG